MSEAGALSSPEPSAWTHVAQAAALFAVDPAGLQGIILRAPPGPVRERWLEQLRELMPRHTPWRRLPLHTGDDRLLGGLDLPATLRAGRPVTGQGLLAESDGGVLLITMAERIEPGVAGKLAAVLDAGVVALERGGLSERIPARLGMVALDEGIEAEEATPETLKDRFAIHLDLASIPPGDIGEPCIDCAGVEAARARLSCVRSSDAVMESLCTTALIYGIESLRAPLLAIRVARAAAALHGRQTVSDMDAELAARMVFGCRATRLPEQEEPHEQEDEQGNAGEDPSDSATEDASEEATEEESRTPGETIQPSSPGDEEEEAAGPQGLDDRVLEATRAAIPSQLMQQLRYPAPGRGGAQSSARSVARRRPARRGRPVGSRRGDPSEGGRLNLVETLRAAAPWQGLRRAEAASPADMHRPAVRVRREDFRINRYQQQAATTTVFAVDASGSSALHRLAEVKGAVELLLAESYQRRDQVALIAFRGNDAELLLPPTRSLVRAKRSLAALPGGGGTPLAAGIRLALETALKIQRRGETPVIVLLTDGRANVALNGQPERERAEREALEGARGVRAEGLTALLVDASPRPRPVARELADAMGAFYLALPRADAEKLTGAARTVLSDRVNRSAQP